MLAILESRWNVAILLSLPAYQVGWLEVLSLKDESVEISKRSGE